MMLQFFLTKCRSCFVRIFYPNFYTNFKHGKNFRSNTKIDSLFPELVEIGDNFISAPGSRILSHDASLLLFTRKIRANRTIIGNDVFLGANSIVMSGVHISDRVIVGAGAVVTKDIPSNSVVAGNPAKFICSVDEYILKCEQKKQLYEISDDFKNALNENTPITMKCTKSIRRSVYKQLKLRS